MILSVLIRKIILFFAPMILFYFLRRIGKNRDSQKSHRSFADKNNIVDGEIIKDQE